MEEVAVGIFFTNSSWPLRCGEGREHLWAQQKSLKEVVKSGEELVLLVEE